MCPFGRGDVKSRCNDERPCKFSRGKTPPRICLSDYPDVLLLAFLLILSSSSVVGFSYLKAQSLSTKHLMLGSTGAFLQEHCKKKKSHLFFALYQGVFLGVVLVKCSVYFVLSPAITIFWKDEPCLQMFIKQVSFLYDSMLDFSMLTFKHKY